MVFLAFQFNVTNVVFFAFPFWLKQTGSSTIKHPWPIPKQTAAMPLSEPMKAAIVLAIVMAVVPAPAVLAMVAAVLGELPTLVLEASPEASNTSVGGFFEDLVRVILATANMLKNHLPPIAGATAFALSLPSWGCKTWEPRKCGFTVVASTHSTDSGWDRHTDREKCSQAKKNNDPTYTMVKVHGTVPKR